MEKTQDGPSPKIPPQKQKKPNKQDTTMAYRYKRAYDLTLKNGKKATDLDFVRTVIELAESDKEL